MTPVTFNFNDDEEEDDLGIQTGSPGHTAFSQFGELRSNAPESLNAETDDLFKKREEEDAVKALGEDRVKSYIEEGRTNDEITKIGMDEAASKVQGAHPEMADPLSRKDEYVAGDLVPQKPTAERRMDPLASKLDGVRKKTIASKNATDLYWKAEAATQAEMEKVHALRQIALSIDTTTEEGAQYYKQAMTRVNAREERVRMMAENVKVNIGGKLYPTGDSEAIPHFNELLSKGENPAMARTIVDTHLGIAEALTHANAIGNLDPVTLERELIDKRLIRKDDGGRYRLNDRVGMKTVLDFIGAKSGTSSTARTGRAGKEPAEPGTVEPGKAAEIIGGYNKDIDEMKEAGVDPLIIKDRIAARDKAVSTMFGAVNPEAKFEDDTKRLGTFVPRKDFSKSTMMDNVFKLGEDTGFTAPTGKAPDLNKVAINRDDGVYVVDVGLNELPPIYETKEGKLFTSKEDAKALGAKQLHPNEAAARIAKVGETRPDGGQGLWEQTKELAKDAWDVVPDNFKQESSWSDLSSVGPARGKSKPIKPTGRRPEDTADERFVNVTTGPLKKVAGGTLTRTPDQAEEDVYGWIMRYNQKLASKINGIDSQRKAAEEFEDENSEWFR